MARQALRGADLSPGASLRGIVFDTCFSNSIPHTFGILKHFGMPNRNRVLVSESRHLNTAGLAAALRIDETEVIERRYPAHGRGHRIFFGIHVMKRRIEARVRRFSPAAIAKGVQHHPATHELKDLPFSTVGWDMLHDTCPCTEDGVVQNWVTVNGSTRCHACGGSLGKIASVPVPDALRLALRLIASIVDPDPARQEAALEMLPITIRGVSRTLLYDMVMNIARMVSPDVDEDDFSTRTTALARACDAVINWPEGLAEISRSENCPVSVWEWVRRHYGMLDVCGHSAVVRQRAAPVHAVANAAHAATYAPSGSAGWARSSLLGAMAAARLCGVDESALKKAWDEGRFTQHKWVQGSLRVRAFDPVEVVAVAPFLRVAGSRARAASDLGLPIYGLEQLLERDLFSPVSPGPGIKQTEAHMAAAQAFVEDLQRAKTDVTGSIAFVEAIRHVSGRMKPWGAAFAAMLDGDIPFAVAEACDDPPFVGRLRVSPEAITALLALSETEVPKVAIERAKYWMQGDALECLNGNRSAGELLDGLASLDTPKKKRYLVADVLHRASLGVTTSDIARRFGCTIMRAAITLDANKVPQIAPGLWNRNLAEATVRKFLTLGSHIL
ncbi:hypothetical protein AB5I39_08635 [Sphingomonas sp. MMS24-J45]|uniref:hypothetical protein n=1 Tax=Sphingomonas sp. MMS24-J45 TaxID=3238806 RepID=UPI00384F038C